MVNQTRRSISWITRTAVLLALLIVIQIFPFPQPFRQFITGPLVNMILLIAAISTGLIGSITLALISPWMAWLVQTHAAFGNLLPVIPYIMIGNAVYVCLFLLFRLKKKNVWFDSIGILLGSGAKFIVLYTAVTYIIIKYASIPPMIAKAMSFPQLITALAGGVLALLLEQILKPTKILSK